MAEPVIIQGGMGAAVSSWRLARAVAREGHLGVVSGTALDVVLARRLQDGDEGGHVRRALSHFPVAEIAERILQKWYRSGRTSVARYRAVPKFRVPIPIHHQELVVAANFVEIHLAREGHDGRVGINYLEKITIPNLPSIFGAMLAGVHYVLMGAGIPRDIPGAMDRLAQHLPVSIPLPVEGALEGDDFRIEFDPSALMPAPTTALTRPRFLAIVASTSLATTLARKASGRVDGFIVEGPTAGGHNAPPRGTMQLDAKGEPIYGPRDDVDLKRIADLGLPFWLAGKYGTALQLREAQARGAVGIQVGTAFALCRESGLEEGLRRRLLGQVRTGGACIFTDPLASPTGFPFKVVRLSGTLSEDDEVARRERLCDLGFLRRAYRRDDGTPGYRCPAEPADAFVAKGGAIEETVGRKCLCNGLMANVGMPQVRRSEAEKPLLTAGDDLPGITRFIPAGEDDYSAADVIRVLLGA